jgi:hypothetical protein
LRRWCGWSPGGVGGGKKKFPADFNSQPKSQWRPFPKQQTKQNKTKQTKMIVLPKSPFAASLEVLAILFLLLRRKKFFSNCKRRVSEFCAKKWFLVVWFVCFLHVSCCALWVVTSNLLVSMYVGGLLFSARVYRLPLSLIGHLDCCIYPPVITPTFACLLPLGSQPFFFSFLGGEFWANNRERKREGKIKLNYKL